MNLCIANEDHPPCNVPRKAIKACSGRDQLSLLGSLWPSHPLSFREWPCCPFFSTGFLCVFIYCSHNTGSCGPESASHVHLHTHLFPSLWSQTHLSKRETWAHPLPPSWITGCTHLVGDHVPSSLFPLVIFQTRSVFFCCRSVKWGSPHFFPGMLLSPPVLVFYCYCNKLPWIQWLKMLRARKEG